MKFYYDPRSTTCRPVTLFAADEGLELDLEPMDLFAGDNFQEAYGRINPSQLVPFLVDDDLSLGESSAILKYLADKVGSSAYPAELKPRARVNAAMDWFNTRFHTDFCALHIYPQILPPDHLPQGDLTNLISYGGHASARWLDVLDKHVIGSNRYVCGDQITLADYLGAPFATLGDLAGFDFSRWPNVSRWLDVMRSRPGWASANAGFNGWLTALRSPAMVA